MKYFSFIIFFLIYKISLEQHKKSKLTTIYTEWGESLDKENILQEYPRPQFERKSYLNLNGEWKYFLTKSENVTPTFNKTIIVPFSIESPLSGVKNESLEPGMILYYQKYINLSQIENLGKYLLNFGAVDQYCEVYINSQKVGNHYGGYTFFTFDITKYITINETENVELIVKVTDNYNITNEGFGKQGKPRGRIWYTATGGIWQTVWIESVPKNYIKNVKITPNYDKNEVSFFLQVFGDPGLPNKVKIFDQENITLIAEKELEPNKETIVTLPQNFHSWSPENPYLYKIIYTYGEDIVFSYFGMRKFSINFSNNKPKFFLNNKPYFAHGLLDQGYWSDGLYTPPSDDAIIYDIQTMKNLGFNMLRKHIKQESLRWYYHCDKIGMLVFQDQPCFKKNIVNYYHPKRFEVFPDTNYAFFERENEKGRQIFIRDIFRTIEQLYNVVSICVWVPFNEAWGQFDSEKISNLIKGFDKSRLVDHASGWSDNNGNDITSLHNYARKLVIDESEYLLGRPVMLTEYGGLGLKIDEHVGSNMNYNYGNYQNCEMYNKAVETLLNNEIIKLVYQGLSAAVYTQVSDVEDELNGLMTYDRKVLKVDEKMMKGMNQKIQMVFQSLS